MLLLLLLKIEFYTCCLCAMWAQPSCRVIGEGAGHRAEGVHMRVGFLCRFGAPSRQNLLVFSIGHAEIFGRYIFDGFDGIGTKWPRVARNQFLRT